MEIRKVLIVGSGTLGQQIGFQCAMHGFETIMYDVHSESLDSCRASHRQYAELFTGQLGKSRADVDAALSRLSYTTDLAEAGRDADLVSESVPESPEIKNQVYALLHKHCPAKTIFTTNTSTLLPSQFAEATGRPARFCALHFANEIWLRNIGEVMGHAGTDPEIYEIVAKFAKDIGMVPIRLSTEQNGYVINSMLVPWLMAAQALVTNGVARPEDVDKTWMITTKMALGPFGMLDMVGLETAFNVASYWGTVNEDEQYKKNAAYLQTHFLDTNQLGVKTGQGYYTYPEPGVRTGGFPFFAMTPTAHRGLFLCAACFNWLAGGPLLVATTPVARILGLDVGTPTAALFVHVTAGVIVVFGGAYAMIARDPVRYRVYIPLGIILKIYLVAVVYGWWLSGGIPWPLPALAAGDIVFAALFWRYYRGSRTASLTANRGIPT